MDSYYTDHPAPIYHYLFVRPDDSGGYTAGVLGLPEVRVSAPTRHEAVKQVKIALDAWLETTRWIQLRVPDSVALSPTIEFAPWLEPEDSDQEKYLEESARLNQEERERVLKEDREDRPA